MDAGSCRGAVRRWLDYLPDGDTITPEQFKDCVEMIWDVAKTLEGWRARARFILLT